MDIALTKPLLLLVFNRPEKTKTVWAEIKKAKPHILYISCDGPRENINDDIDKVRMVRELVSDKNIDWPCSVKRLYHDSNQGVSRAGYHAFKWVFSQEEEMIELEDDCVPSQSFFWFCQELLDKYKNNERICYITGNNNAGVRSGSASYYFSRYGGSWGWATWKRVWQRWDYYMSDFPVQKNTKKFKERFGTNKEFNFWRRKFERKHLELNLEKSKSYDIQTLYLVFKNDMFNIIPNYNLVTNIGWDDEATNTNQTTDKFSNAPRLELEHILHPTIVQIDTAIDLKIFNYCFYSNFNKLKYIKNKMKSNFIKPILHNLKCISPKSK